MNVLSQDKKALILSQLVEGNSIRSIERMTGVHRDSIMRVLVSAGDQAQRIMDYKMRGLRSNYIQVDEIWCYVAMKQKEANKRFYNNPEVGDQYTFVAMDADTKLVPYYSVGKRTGRAALEFMQELSNRVVTRFQLSTDAFAPYYESVAEVFGSNVDYGQIHKQYGEERQEQKRYSPANIIRITKNR